MTIQEVVDRIDAREPNTTSDSAKISWLVQLDAQIREDVVETHELEGTMQLGVGADKDSTPVGELLLPRRFATVYEWYLRAMIQLENNELQRYENYAALYNQAYSTFKNAYNRGHMPLSVGGRKKYVPTKLE